MGALRRFAAGWRRADSVRSALLLVERGEAPAARQLLDYLAGPEARLAFSRAGFGLAAP